MLRRSFSCVRPIIQYANYDTRLREIIFGMLYANIPIFRLTTGAAFSAWPGLCSGRSVGKIRVVGCQCKGV